MLSLLVFVVYFTTATTTLGFSFSPVQNTRHPHRPFDDKSACALPATNNYNNNNILQATQSPITRRDVVSTSFCTFVTNLLVATTATPTSANAFSAAVSGESSSGVASASASASTLSSSVITQKAIAYKTISLPITEFGIDVPVSIWYPVGEENYSTPSPAEIKYSYRISLRRIGQLLAKWDFIPEFISRDFVLNPSVSSSSSTTVRVVDGKNIPIPAMKVKKGDDTTAGTKVVFLAHGFLGSRSDLGYIAEDLAAQGFVCVAPEYPESLEASYPRFEGLDRTAINRRLIPYVQDTVVSQQYPILSYSAIGHSLGCGTVLQMGDDSWNRVLMGSGKAPELPSLRSNNPEETSTRNKIPAVGGRLLFISSVNDGPVTSWGGGIRIPEGYTVLQESQLNTMSSSTTDSKLDRVALVFDRDDAPNHISYLSENVNDAMLSFLSPLLPVTKALNIPVLDFDKYADSRDSVPTGNVLKPLISNFLLAAPE